MKYLKIFISHNRNNFLPIFTKLDVEITSIWQALFLNLLKYGAILSNKL
jgi:hypothetical protein